MFIFMQYEKAVLRWGGPLMLLSIVSPALYLVSRIVMIAGVIAAFRGMDPKTYQTYVVKHVLGTFGVRMKFLGR